MSDVLRKRRRILAGTAAAVFAVNAMPALAADECGAAVGGAAACTGAGNPYAAGITYAGAGPLSVTADGTVAASGTLSVTSTGSTATVANAGTISTSAANQDGIYAAGPDGASVTSTGVATTGADSAGIIAFSTGGPVSVDSLSSTVAAPGGAAILAVGSGPVTVTSGVASAVNNSAIYVTSVNGDATVTVNGTTTAMSSDAVVANSGGTTTVDVAAAGSATGVNGLNLSSKNGTTVNNAGTLLGTNGYAVEVMLGTGTINNTGTLTGRVLFGGANNSLVNSGTFNITGFSNFGTGTSTFTNMGLVQLAAVAPLAGNAFLHLSAFDNSGTLSLVNGRAGDVLTLPGTFTGSGASTLALDTSATGTDTLVIGGAATGSTTVSLVSTGGALVNPGAVIVTAGAGTSADAFTVAGNGNAGFVHYGLVFDATANTFTLSGTPSVDAYRPLRYVEAARSIFYRVADVWAARMRSLRDAPAATGRLWGQFYGSADRRNAAQGSSAFGVTATQDLRYRQDYYGGQAGFDVGKMGGGGGVALGLTGGYQSSHLTFDGSTSQARFDTVNGGGYASFSAGSLFVNLLGQYDHYAIHADSSEIDFERHVHGYSYGARGEAGIRAGSGGFYVEPLVSVDYVRTHLNGFAALDSDFHFGTNIGLRGKAGARLGSAMTIGHGATLTLYGGGNAVKEFCGRGGLAFVNNGATFDLRNRRIGPYGEGYGGLQVVGAAGVSGFVEGFGDYGKSDTQRGGGGRVGLRIAI